MGTASNLSAIQNSVAKMTIRPSDLGDDQTFAPDGSTQQGTQNVMTSPQENITSPLGAQNVMTSPDAVQNGMTSQGGSQTVMSPSSEGSAHSAGDQRAGSVERESSGSSNILSASGSNSSVSPIPNQEIPAEVPPGEVSLTNLPHNLADLQNPNTFKIELDPKGKKKVTKSSFIEKDTSIADSTNDPEDPLSQLDPLWTVKPKDQ